MRKRFEEGLETRTWLQACSYGIFFVALTFLEKVEGCSHCFPFTDRQVPADRTIPRKCSQRRSWENASRRLQVALFENFVLTMVQGVKPVIHCQCFRGESPTDDLNPCP